MRETGTINVEKRDNTSSNSCKRLRKAGFLPGNVSGKGIESIAVSVNKSEFKKILAQHGRNSVYNLVIGGDKAYSVIAKDFQYGPVDRELLHVDFQQVSFSEKIKTDVAVRIIGKEQVEARKMIPLQHVDFIHVKGLPQNLPDFIDIDISNLQVGENMFIRDIKFPEGISAEADMEELVVSISEAKSQVLEAEETENAVAEESEPA